MIEAINERPILDNLSPEARIREKLKFFNLEKEDLKTTKRRIAKRMSNMGARFDLSESPIRGKDGEATESRINPFAEMMAIE